MSMTTPSKMRAVNAALDVIAGQKVGLTTLRLLCCLAERGFEGQVTPDLSRTLKVEASGVSRMGVAMEAEGLIKRTPVRRGSLTQHHLSLTAEGMEMVDAFVTALTGGSKK
jgi:DNA-binding MarR family transcriptional regulator